MRRILILFSFVLSSLLFFQMSPTSVHAASDFKTDYNVEYFLQDENNTLTAHVKFEIAITNYTNNSYVKRLGFTFPKSFAIKNLSAKDDKGTAVSEIQLEDQKTKVNLEFNDPEIGRNTTNTFYVEFDQDNLFRQNGAVWEVVLPTIDDSSRATYNVKVHLPVTTTKKISIAKPNPTEIHGTDITWNNPSSKTIYAVFGNEQYYETQLQYHLQNTKDIPVYTEVAFPPDTLYQKVFVDSINPRPTKIYMDEDGNYIGRYDLKAKETIDVMFKSTIAIYAKPRSELFNYTASQVSQQKDYLLSPSKYWSLSNPDMTKQFKNSFDIYNYLVTTFQYNYSRVDKNLKRLGADTAIKNPLQAVCMEFTDAFVAIAREKGIMSREMEGYGFSQDPELRPISLTSDVLHAWPEFYNSDKNIWIPVDPTWENTSGIDYYSSFDLNHIVFAIHGKQSDYPFPAGSYKTGESKDVFIKPTSTIPETHTQLSIDSFDIKPKIDDSTSYKSTIVVTNMSGQFIYDVPLEFKTEHLFVSPDQLRIPVIAPYERREIPLEYGAQEKNKHQTGKIEVLLLGKSVYSATTTIAPFTYEVALRIAGVIGIISFIWIAYYLLKKRKPIPPPEV